MTIAIPLGYKQKANTNSIGFSYVPNKTSSKNIIYDNSETSMLTIASTGSGKGRCNIIPTCLKYGGPLIVVDIKGEAAKVTAKAREKISDVYIVDPFKKVTNNPAKFNPFEMVVSTQSIEQQAAVIASALQPASFKSTKEVFWDNMAHNLIAAACIYALSTDKKFSTMRDIFYADDMVYRLAVLMDTKTVTSKLACEMFNSFLQTPDVTRGGISSTAQQYIGILGEPAVLENLNGPTSFDIKDLFTGEKAMTIYFVIPPNKLSAFSTLLRLWISSVINVISDREVRPMLPTLMLIDECYNLGKLDNLISAITLMRCYGLKIWCFFQSIAQIKQLYPTEWMTIIDNCDVIEAFGFKQYMSAKDMCDVVGGITASQLLKTKPDQAILMKAGEPYQVIQKLDYLKDKMFKNTGFEPNPFYRHSTIR